MPSRWRGKGTRFVLICTGLLVIDAVVGFVSFGRCTNAGDACSTANEWTDSVTFVIGLLLVGLIALGALGEVIERYRSHQRGPYSR
jgi:hypothetical protein